MAVKRYVITDNLVDAALDNLSTNPIQNKVIKEAVDKKLNRVGYSTTLDVGKVPQVDALGNLELVAPTPQVNPDWNEDATTSKAFIQNRPFKNVGTGLSVVTIAGVPTIQADTQLHFEIFATLPTPSESYKQIIALVPKGTPETSNIYNEYACVGSGTTWAWELIGDLKTTLDQTPTAIKINGIALQEASDLQVGVMSSADHGDMQRKSNLVTMLTGTDDTKYPSEKAVYNQLQLKQDVANIVTAFSATTSDTKYPSEKLVKDQLDLKQDVSNITTTIAEIATASDTKYPSEKATRTELDTKQDVSNLVTAFSATTSDTKYPSEKLTKDSLDAKVNCGNMNGAALWTGSQSDYDTLAVKEVNTIYIITSDL